MTLYAIRHKPSGLIMPLLAKNRGYSWWNPPQVPSNKELGVPRLLPTRKRAQQCISQWFATQNAHRTIIQSYDGEYDDIVDNKNDDRKKEDLEIVEVELQLP